MDLSMSMFASTADYWKARAELAEKSLADLQAEIERLRAALARAEALYGHRPAGSEA